MFPLRALSQSFFHFYHTIIDLGHFHPFRFSLHVLSDVFTIPFSFTHHLTDIYTHTDTHTHPARHVTQHHHIATRLQHHCVSLFPLAVGCTSFHFRRQRNGTFRSLRNAPLPFLPHYAKSEPPQRVYPRFPEADISSYLPLANTAQLKTIFLLFVLLLWTPPTPPIPQHAAQHKDCHSALTRQIAAATGCCHQVAFATSCSSNSIFLHKETLQHNPFENYKHFNNSTFNCYCHFIHTSRRATAMKY